MTENELKSRLREIALSCGDSAPSGTPEPAGPAIYLTFDDGPGPYTAGLLDTLKDCGVRATFFVTAQNPDCLDAISRASAEGHSIGAHTFSHAYREIYAGDGAFLLDFLECEEMIRARTGSYTALFRFPGGSSNTISRITSGIVTRMSETLTAMGFRYFDWNVDSGDASGISDGGTVLRNITEGCRGRRASLVLQHDIKSFSVGIVRDVIAWGRENGYCFLPLGPDSPAAKHRIAN